MPLEPKECRQQALACVRLAQTSASLQTRLQYAHLAKTLLTLNASSEAPVLHEPRLQFTANLDASLK